MTYSLYDAHTEPLFRQLDILTLRKLVIHRIALLMFKFNIGILPQPTMQLFIRNTDVHNHNTRTKDSLHVQMGRSERTYVNVSFHGVHIWNILPNMFRQIFLMQASNMYQNYIYIHMIYSIDIGHKFTLYMYFTSRSSP